VWGSPEMLHKEKTKRIKARQKEYEGKLMYPTERLHALSLSTAIFSLKKSLKVYQRRLEMLRHAPPDDQKTVSGIRQESVFRSPLRGFRVKRRF
jgi:hypothetical protein